MKREIKKIISVIAVVGAMIGMHNLSVAADNGGLQVAQRASKINQMVQAQEYDVSYTSDGKTAYNGGTKFDLSLEEGFSAEKLVVGEWSDYEGNVVVSLFDSSQKEPVYSKTVKESETVDLKPYENIRNIVIQSETAVAATTNITEVKLSGTIYAKKTDGSLTTKVEYLGAEDGEEFASIDTKKVTTDCFFYELNKPELSLDNTILNQLDALKATISKIGGTGTGIVDSLTLEMDVPSRMITDRIVMPAFENATAKLYIDGSLRKVNTNGTYNVGSKIKNIQVIVKFDGPMKQTKDMEVSMRNTSVSAGTESLNISVKASLSNGETVTASSGNVNFTCKELEIITPPVEPEEPPVTPETPTVPPENNEIPEKPEKPERPERPAGPDVPVHPPVIGEPISKEQDQTEKTENKVVDLSGVNLQSARAEGKSPILASVTKSDNLRTVRLQAANDERVQETRVFDFSSGTVRDEEEKPEVLENNDTVNEEDSIAYQPAEEIKKTPKEQAAEDLKKVSDNRFLPVIVLLAVIVMGGIMVTIFLFKDKKTDEKDIADASETDETENYKTDKDIMKNTP